ncbi:MAG: PA14 domain-containing protein [Caldilineaceae bacterium]
MLPAQTDAAWQAAYWNNTTLSGDPVLTRVETSLNNNWSTSSPHALVNVDGFSARWTRYIDVTPGAYRFTATADDGIRLWVDGDLIIDQWRVQAAATYSAEKELGFGNHLLQVEYFEQSSAAIAQVSWELAAASPDLPAQPTTGWRGEYYNNQSLSGTPDLVRFDADINFQWGTGSPGLGILADGFSARWTRVLDLPAGDYRFSMTVDDGGRLFVNGQTVIDAWSDQRIATYTGDITLAGGPVTIQMEYYERTLGAYAILGWDWRPATQTPPQQPTTGWRAEYYNNRDLSGDPALVRSDTAINFDWGRGSPAPGTINEDNFSVRWTRRLNLPAGNYRFTTTVDDGVRLAIDDRLLIDNWRQQARTTNSGEIYLPGGPVTVVMTYFDAGDHAIAQLDWVQLSGQSGSGGNWRGQYFNNRDLSGNPEVVVDEPAINFNWGYDAPGLGIGRDNFSARWTRTLDLTPGRYRFSMGVDDGGRLFVNDQLVIDGWRDQPLRIYTAEVDIRESPARLRMEYYEGNGEAAARLAWTLVGAAEPTEPVDTDWRTFRSPRFGVQFEFPASWRPSPDDAERYSGADGFFVLNASGGATLDDFADNEISHPLRPYGLNPQVIPLTVDGQDARLILPSANQSSELRQQSALVVQYPEPRQVNGATYEFFVLYTSQPYIRHMADSLKFVEGGVVEGPLPTPTAPAPANAVIVDDADAGFTRGGVEEGWRTEREGTNGSLTWSLNSERTLNGYNWGRWNPELRPGRYEVFVYIPDRFSTTERARYWVSHAGGLTLRLVDQAANGNRWVSLGTFNFSGAERDYVSLADVTFEPDQSRLVVWDAVKWEER